MSASVVPGGMDEPEVELPWIDEPMPVSEAVELLGRTTEDDAETLNERLSDLQGRVDDLEDGTDATCPYCEKGDDVLKSGVAAGKLADEGSLSEANVAALNRYSHVCMECRKAFTPHEEPED